MITKQNRKILYVDVIKEQTWFLYKIYNKDGKFVCFMGQPIGNSRCSVFGTTEESLKNNIKKYMTTHGYVFKSNKAIER